MKEIKAVIQPFKLTNVIEALKQIEGLPGITVDEHVHGFGKSGGEGAQRKITVDLIDCIQKVKLELVVPEKLVESVIRTIQENAYTGNPGDGKIFVYDVQDLGAFSQPLRCNSAPWYTIEDIMRQPVQNC